MVEIIVIGGSAGSLKPLMVLLDALPEEMPYAVVIVLHRLKNVTSDMDRILSYNKGKRKIHEPEDKEPIRKNHIYLAPQNYHLLIEEEKIFSLDYSELINYSRPSIDITFDCAADVYGNGVLGILLSGANADGADGISKIIENGGISIVQHPATAEYPVMPQSAIERNEHVLVKKPEFIANYIQALSLFKL
jgi:Chemotaxis response regulator containing a CheY-like receiver domain and a methylesterase domain